MTGKVDLAETRIYFSHHASRAISLWSVRGISPGWFPNRALAEAAALANFPDESSVDRYYRLHEVRFYEEEGRTSGMSVR